MARRLSFCAFFFLIVTAQQAIAGPIHCEQAFACGATHGDAGPLPISAQNVNTAPGAPVKHIIGELKGNNLLLGPGDFEDMFLIEIRDVKPDGVTPCTFSANTFGPLNAFDTQLWMFRADGRGLLGNDDDNGATDKSLITFPANDTTGQAYPGNGFYYIAVSGGIGTLGSGGGGDDPLSAGGAIFDFTDAPGALQISGPDGAGGLTAINAWSATGLGAIGVYDIEFSDCVYMAPEPASFILLFLGGVAITRRRVCLARG